MRGMPKRVDISSSLLASLTLTNECWAISIEVFERLQALGQVGPIRFVRVNLAQQINGEDAPDDAGGLEGELILG